MSASTACVPAAAADASSRIYMVTIAQTGTLLQIQVKAPVMLNAEWLKISGRVIDRTVTITMPVDDFYYPFYGIKFYAVQEILGPGRILVIAGTARGDRLGDVVTGSLDGEFALYRNENNGAVWNQDFSCQRSDHGFRLDRD
jgi:hypothetical protein